MTKELLEKYNEVREREEVDGWFRYMESKTHIFFAKRIGEETFDYKVVAYNE